MARTFEQFVEAVRDSLEGQAERKGYSVGGVNGPNPLAEFAAKTGLDPGHSIGEIVFKCVEYLKQPREVALFKIAAWSYILWKHSPGDDRNIE